jgi:hypothetical protein
MLPCRAFPDCFLSIFFILTFFFKKNSILHRCFFIFKSNTFGRAKVRGAAKTRCRAICIGAAQSATSDNDFHMEILAAPLPLAQQHDSATPFRLARQDETLKKYIFFI